MLNYFGTEESYRYRTGTGTHTKLPEYQYTIERPSLKLRILRRILRPPPLERSRARRLLSELGPEPRSPFCPPPPLPPPPHHFEMSHEGPSLSQSVSQSVSRSFGHGELFSAAQLYKVKERARSE